MTFEVEAARNRRRRSTETLTAMPDDTPPWVEPTFPSEPLKVPGSAWRTRCEPGS